MSLKLLKISYLVDAAFDDVAPGARSQADDDKFVEFVARSGADIVLVPFQTQLAVFRQIAGGVISRKNTRIRFSS